MPLNLCVYFYIIFSEPLTNFLAENSTTANVTTDSTQAGITTSNQTTKSADITSELVTLNATPLSTDGKQIILEL